MSSQQLPQHDETSCEDPELPRRPERAQKIDPIPSCDFAKHSKFRCMLLVVRYLEELLRHREAARYDDAAPEGR